MQQLLALPAAAPQLAKEPPPALASLLGRAVPSLTWQGLLCRCFGCFKGHTGSLYIFAVCAHVGRVSKAGSTSRVTLTQMNPELMGQAMDLFKNMDPDMLANMAQSMGGPSGPGTQTSAGLDMPQNAAAMQQMLNDPQASQMSHREQPYEHTGGPHCERECCHIQLFTAASWCAGCKDDAQHDVKHEPRAARGNVQS